MEREAEGTVDLALLAARSSTPAQGRRTGSRRERGDTVMRLFLRAEIPRKQAAAAIGAMRKVYDPRRIVPGQKMVVTS